MTEVTQAWDTAARAEALVTSGSYIVQAPAGSGKTELLTQRFLQLLGEVESPEQILAITFTRAATAEMRGRILESLERAMQADPTPQPADSTYIVARRALHHAQQRGWDLLKNPQLLRIETIDSFCLSLAHRTPILARLGGRLQPTESAGPLYARAARRTLQQLGGEDRELSEAIAALLAIRDNGLTECEQLIAEMLACRDRWQHAYVLSTDAGWQDEARVELEKPFARAIRDTLNRLEKLFAASGVDEKEILLLASFACRNLNAPDCAKYSRQLSRIAALLDHTVFPPSTEDQIEAWVSLANFLLIGKGTWRGRVTVAEGFPSGSDLEKQAFREFVFQLNQTPGLRETLCEVKQLPPAHYSEEQWDLLLKLFRTLRHASAELNVVFAEEDVVDFVEIALAAERVLQHQDETLGEIPTELALAKSEQLRHILVDEFQDTSRRQHSLLRMLASGWSPEEGRTCFLVGDPMQSIYLFRQAEVELFYQAGMRGLGPDLPLKKLQLTTNFRSDRGVVEPLNEILAPIFDQTATPVAASVVFTPSIANDPMLRPRNVHIVANLIAPQLSGTLSRLAVKQAQNREAQQVVRIVEAHLGRISAAERNNDRYRIAILGRARNHLLQIAEALHKEGIPFRAVEMENLGERQEVLDISALLRALLHPMDRVAWLAVLRAPWCGLTLADLHQLCGADDNKFAKLPVLELLRMRIDLLSPDGQRRARATHSTLEAALHQRLHRSSSQSLPAWVERVWHSLGGPECVDPTAYENAQLFFSMLAELDADGTAYLGGELDARLQRLFALPDPATSEDRGVQLMTIHKAKGLGFEVVILPALDRPTGADDTKLLSWLERSTPHSEIDAEEEREILVAPIGGKGEDAGDLTAWVKRQQKARLTEEQKRLFYVACTRARHELHLLGTATIKLSKSDTLTLTPGGTNSLLQTAWPGLEADYLLELERWKEEQARSNVVLSFPASEGKAEQMVLDLAAAEDQPALRRLPESYSPASLQPNVTVTDTFFSSMANAASFERPSASIVARAFGIAVHALLDKTAQLLTQLNDWQQARLQISGWKFAAENILRQQGVSIAQTSGLAAKVIATVTAALEDKTGRWILSPHGEAQSEAGWSGWWKGAIRSVRADRVFVAGDDPSGDGNHVYWIIDYKTASHSSNGLAEFMSREKEEYKAQLETYAEVLRMLKGPQLKIKLGLYYPSLQKLEAWSA